MRMVTILVALAVVAALGIAGVRPVVAQSGRTGPSGLALPRFVSLKAEPVNLRKGPGTQYPAAWVLRRAGMPLEVIEEFEGWRKVRDADGTVGWVLGSLLSGRRSAVVMPWERKPNAEVPVTPLRSSTSSRASQLASLEAGTIADVVSCDRNWCEIRIGPYSGYIEQAKLWGVYEGEVVK